MKKEGYKVTITGVLPVSSASLAGAIAAASLIEKASNGDLAPLVKKLQSVTVSGGEAVTMEAAKGGGGAKAAAAGKTRKKRRKKARKPRQEKLPLGGAEPAQPADSQ